MGTNRADHGDQRTEGSDGGSSRSSAREPGDWGGLRLRLIGKLRKLAISDFAQSPVAIYTQGHLTWTLGHNPDILTHTIYDAMVGERELGEVILKTAFGPDLAPNNIVSSEAEDYLRGKPNWGSRLANAMRGVRSQYDYVILDPGPNLSSLTINALYAADYLVIPTELEMLSLKGLQLLLKRVDETRIDFNPRLQVAGAVAMMVQTQTNVSRAMDQTLRQALLKRNIRAFTTTIKRSTKYGEASMLRQVMVTLYPRSEHTRAYKSLLAELLKVVGGPGLERVSLLRSSELEEGESPEPAVAAYSEEAWDRDEQASA